MNTCEVSERAKKAPDQRKRQRVTSRTCELANEPSAVCPGQRVNAHVRLLRKDITDFTIRSPHVELPRGLGYLEVGFRAHPGQQDAAADYIGSRTEWAAVKAVERGDLR